MIWINTSFRINKAAILASKINSQKSLIKKSKQLIYNCPAHNYSRRRALDRPHPTSTCSIAWTSTVWTNAHPISTESSARNLNHPTGLIQKSLRLQVDSALTEGASQELHQWLEHQTCQQLKEISQSFKCQETTQICVYQKIPTKSPQWTTPPSWRQSNRISFVLPRTLSKFWPQS